MNRYTCTWFSALEWKWMEFDFLAESEEQLRAHIDTLCPEEYRTGNYYRVTRGMDDISDSLQFDSVYPVTIPFQLNAML